MMIRKADRIEIHKAPRVHRVGNIVSSEKIVPEETAIATVRKITKTKQGRKVHVWDDRGYGYAIMVDALPDFMTVSILEC